MLDNFFHTELQLKGNRAYTNFRDLEPARTSPFTWHGDAVSEVIAAYGNDSSGMTGVMWRAGLRQYDIAVVQQTSGGLVYVRDAQGNVANSVRSTRRALINAARDGARVINMSMYVSATSLPTAAQIAKQNQALAALADGMRTIETKLKLPLPLLVLIAGNNTGLDASASVLPRLGVLYPQYANNIVVVGSAQLGTSSVLNVDAGASTGRLVEIVAPGDNVGGISPSGVITQLGGTSVAAP